MLNGTVESVNSALKRARATLDSRRPTGDVPPAPHSAAERALVERFVHAYQSGDVDALVGLLTADVRLTMPPVPLEYHGRQAVELFYAACFGIGATHLSRPAPTVSQPSAPICVPPTNRSATQRVWSSST